MVPTGGLPLEPSNISKINYLIPPYDVVGRRCRDVAIAAAELGRPGRARDSVCRGIQRLHEDRVLDEWPLLGRKAAVHTQTASRDRQGTAKKPGQLVCQFKVRRGSFTTSITATVGQRRDRVTTRRGVEATAVRSQCSALNPSAT